MEFYRTCRDCSQRFGKEIKYILKVKLLNIFYFILQDVLAVCSVSFRVQMLFCDRIQIPDDANAVGINILLGAAEGDIVADPEVQRAALCVLIHCVCAPVHRVGGSVGRFNGSAKRRSVVISMIFSYCRIYVFTHCALYRLVERAKRFSTKFGSVYDPTMESWC
jgi:hypothetical protein